MNIYKKILEAKKRMPYLKKDKKGYNYEYTSPEALFGALNPILNEIGLVILMKVVDAKSYPIKVPTKNDPNKEEWKYDLDLIMTWVDTEDGEFVDIPWKASGVNGDDKGLGSALTYAERYFIMKQLNIPTGEDDPDAFQDKHMPQAEKDKKATEDKAKRAADLTAAVAEMQAVTTADGIKAVWDKHSGFKKDGEFVAAKDAMKAKFAAPPAAGTTQVTQPAPPQDTTQAPPAAWQITPEVQKELQALLDNSTLTEKGKAAAATKIAQAKNDADIEAARNGLKSKQKAPPAPPATDDDAPF